MYHCAPNTPYLNYKLNSMASTPTSLVTKLCQGNPFRKKNAQYEWNGSQAWLSRLGLLRVANFAPTTSRQWNKLQGVMTGQNLNSFHRFSQGRQGVVGQTRLHDLINCYTGRDNQTWHSWTEIKLAQVDLQYHVY